MVTPLSIPVFHKNVQFRATVPLSSLRFYEAVPIKRLNFPKSPFLTSVTDPERFDLRITIFIYFDADLDPTFT